MKIDKKVREAIVERLQNSTSVTVDEIATMLDTRLEETDIARLIANEKKNTARRAVASVRGKDNLRTYFAVCDSERTFVNVEHSDGYEKLVMVEKQLKAKRNGINRSLGKVAYLKKAFGKCVEITGAHSEEATALAGKLYAMADELQALLGMQLSA